MTVTQVTIRPMRKSDLRTFSKMMKAMATHFGDKAKVSERDVRVSCFGSKKISTILLAFVSGEPSGFAVTHDWMNFYLGVKFHHISFFFVESKYRRTGVATALLTAIAQAALKAGCQCISLDVGKQNKAAVKFYKKWKFKKRAATTAHYRLTGPGLIRLARRKS